MFGNLFRRKKAGPAHTQEPKRNKALENAERIVEEFGAVPVKPGTVQDAAVLPYDKERIKAALLTVLTEGQDQSRREFLKLCYLSLAEFQDGVDAQAAAAEGDDESAKLVDIREAREYWRNRRRDEHDKLLAELKEHGFGNEPSQLEGRQL